MNSIRGKSIFVALLTLLAIYVTVPSIIYLTQPAEVRNDAELLAKKIPPFFPHSHLNLGLDLQGGVQLVLGVKLDQAVDNKLARLATETTRWAVDEKLPVKTAYVPQGISGRIRVELNDGADIDAFRVKFKEKFPDLEQVDKTGTSIDFAYKAEQIKVIRASALEQAERVIRNRVDKWGVTEPLINRRADGSILAQLPGFKDPEKAKELLGRTAQLKFKIVDDEFAAFSTLEGKLPADVKLDRSAGSPTLISENKQAILDATKGLIPQDRELLFGQEHLPTGKTKYTSYVVKAAAEITGEDVLDAIVVTDTSGLDNRPAVSLRFTDTGGKRFEVVTGNNIRKRMAIILDDVVESAPVIQSKIGGGRAQITLGSGMGQKVYDEANQLSLVLKSGALPATIDILEQRQVGASLGPQLATEGLMGTLLGIVLVYTFMILYYRRPGLIACLALFLNAIYVVACMALFGFALTLPGIAGFVLGLGMAVDANVLVNERIRQELREGKAPRMALDLGFKRVFWTVFDSHVTSLVAAFILLETNTSGPIRGFAVTLIIGLIVSLFTSLYCSHLFFDVALHRLPTPKDALAWLGGSRALKNRNFHFNFLRYDIFTTSLAMLLSVGVIATAAVKGFNWSVDFVGGMEMEVSFQDNMQADALSKTFKDAGLKDVTIQALKGGQKEFLLRFDKEALESIDHSGAHNVEADTEAGGARAHALQNLVSTKFSEHKPHIARVDYVGPQVGKELRKQGFMSMLFAILGIIVYLVLRFDLRFGLGAVLKLIPDTCAMLAFYLFFNRSFDLTSIAALLTGIGYSMNDVIVVFDRIRENMEKHPGRSFKETINESLNETLSRTINTSVVTSLSLVGILVFGHGSIWNFAAAMCIGILGATFTSNFVGSTFLLWFDKIFSGAGKKTSVTPATARQSAPSRL